MINTTIIAGMVTQLVISLFVPIGLLYVIYAILLHALVDTAPALYQAGHCHECLADRSGGLFIRGRCIFIYT
jgi:uncharacterized membrane protein YhfC